MPSPKLAGAELGIQEVRGELPAGAAPTEATRVRLGLGAPRSSPGGTSGPPDIACEEAGT
eukprot:10016777-Alexandrium_andersonii.AAC.1